MALTDYIEYHFAASLIRELMSEGSPCETEVTTIEGLSSKRRDAKGEIDLAIAGYFQNIPDGFYQREFDPGSERTLAACLTHASRTRKPFGVSRVAHG